MASKVQRISKGAPSVSPERETGLLFATIETRDNVQCVEMTAAIRAINGFKDIVDDSALDKQVKQRVAGKTTTLENMANSEFLKRTVKPAKSKSSRGLVSTSDMYTYPPKSKPEHFSALREMWVSYLSTFVGLLDSVRQHDCPPGKSLDEYKYHLMCRKLELIGANAEILDSSNSQLKGLDGLIISESENSLQLMNSTGKLRVIPKQVCTFRVFSSTHSVTLFGPDIAGIGRTGSVYKTPQALGRRRQVNPLEYS